MAFIFAAMKAKSPSESFSTMTELVLPNDTNTLGNLMGGRLLHWMDIVSAIAATRHCNRVCVTAAVDFVDFKTAIRLGETVIMEARVTRTFNTSLEVKILVYAENMTANQRRLSNQAFYTFVAVDQTGRPIPVTPVEPQTDEEMSDYQSAAHRREMRLLLAGRLGAEEAKHVRLEIR